MDDWCDNEEKRQFYRMKEYEQKFGGQSIKAFLANSLPRTKASKLKAKVSTTLYAALTSFVSSTRPEESLTV